MNTIFPIYSLKLCALLVVFSLYNPYMAECIELSSGEALELTADELSYEEETGSVEARGNVLLKSGNIIIKTNILTYVEKEQRVFVKDGFLIKENDDVIKGKSIDYNLADGTGSISEGEIFIKKDNLYLKGKRIDKLGPSKYSIRRASFTTCDGESPAWKVKASKVDLEIGEYLFADHSRLYLKSVPIIYTPKLIFPIKTDRQSGLLIPKVGYSDRDGFTYEQPFFWAISRDRDATFTVNYEDKGGTGGALEYRYINSKESSGDLDFHFVNEKSSSPDKRWAGGMRHTEIFSPDLYGKTDLNFVSDNNFFLDYSDEVNSYSKQRLESRMSITKNWQTYSLVGEFRHYINLDLDENTTLQRLPSFLFTGKRHRIGESPLFFQMESRLDNFWREETDETSGLFKGQRLDIYPVISLPLNPDNMFEFTPKLGLRETVYRTENIQDKWDSRDIYDLNLDFNIPVSRVYSMEREELKGLKHTVEPGLSYSYIPRIDQPQLPYYDSIDNIDKKNTLRINLNNYVVSKRERENKVNYHRLAELKIFRDYDLIEARGKQSAATPWGPVTGQLRVNGENGITLNSDMKYDTYEKKVTYFSSDIEGRNQKGDLLRLSYRAESASNIRYLNYVVKLAPFNFLKVAYSGRYSAMDDSFLDTKYGLALTGQCWSAAITYSERKFPREDKFYLLINLKGLGNIGDSGGLF